MNSRRIQFRVVITAAAALATAGSIALPIAGATGSAAPPTERRQLHADFNGDGFADLAVGVPFEDQAATNDGAVNVIYGGPGGLSAAGNEVWSQGSEGITGTPEAGDLFGYSLAAADFNGDGFTDLAVGVPFEDQAATNDGAVNVIYGGPGGLSAAGNDVWSQGSEGITGTPEAGDQFGYSLAAGNFGNSSQADLAIGVPFEDQAATNDGAVNVIYGATGGLAVPGNEVWSQGGEGITGTPEAGDQFGYSLAAGNFGNGSQADLAIGVPFEDQAATNDGAVNVIYGGTGGLSAAGNEVWSQGGEGITGTPEAGDQFGYSLAAGNFGNGSQADLAIGVPFEDQAATNDGAVNVIYGANTGGLGAAGNEVWSQGGEGITGTPEAGDQFGYSLAAGNFGNSSQADLAVGVPFEDQAATNDGAVNVIYGATGGLAVPGNEVWSQGGEGITGTPEAGDQFGYSLAAGNFGNSSQADLAIGVPFEDQAATNDGAVNVIYGATGGLAVPGNEVWSQGSEGITGTPEAGDQFGTSVATRRP